MKQTEKAFDRCPICGGELVEKRVEKLLRGGVDTAVVKVRLYLSSCFTSFCILIIFLLLFFYILKRCGEQRLSHYVVLARFWLLPARCCFSQIQCQADARCTSSRLNFASNAALLRF